MIKAITLWQPYAQAVVLGLKQYETRSWKTNYRGVLAIHASVKKMSVSYQALAKQYHVDECSYGAVLGTAELTDCILMTDDFIRKQQQREIDLGDWKPGRYAWCFKDVHVFDTPIPALGKQGLWNWNNE